MIVVYNTYMSILFPTNIPWQADIFGNTLVAYLIATAYCVGFLALFKILQSIVLLRLKTMTESTHTDLDDTFVSILQSIKPSFYVVLAIYVAVRTLELPTIALKVVNAALIVVLVAQTLISLQILLNYAVHRRVGQGPSGNADSAVRFLSTIAKVVLWTVGILFILSNIGVNITSLVAGLGIGGIAIALAAQNILTDVFSSLSIYFDKPFHVGDFITVGDLEGTVHRIGIKTTRIKSRDGEEIIISNKELTSGRIKNFSRMDERRVQFDIAVAPATSSKTVRDIPALIEQAVQSVPRIRFEQVHLHAIGASGLSFRVVFYVTLPGFDEYNRARQEVNFNLLEALKKAKIELV